MLHGLVESNIPKKKVCKHSKGWWTTKLTELSKSFRKAKHAFSKRKDQSNEAKLEEIRNILTDFKNATLTSLYVFQNTVVCKIPLIR